MFHPNTGSACQEHRERELRNRQSPLIPECDHNGDYKDKQCHPPSADRTRFCQCWAPNGIVLSPPSKTTDTCKCLSDRYKALNPSGSTDGNGYDSEGNQRRMIGQFIPECETNGKFRKRQCQGYTGQCWCVDQMTGEQTGESLIGNANCN